jgi:hypothetical protein
MLIYCNTYKPPKPLLLTHASIVGNDGERELQPDNKGSTTGRSVPHKTKNQKTLNQQHQQLQQETSAKMTPSSRTPASHGPPLKTESIPVLRMTEDSENDASVGDTAKTNHNINNGKRRHPKEVRHVRFNSVELQEYAITLGDHPFCKGHFPITLDWYHAQPIEMSIRDYEADKAHRRYTPSKSDKWEFHMDTQERWERLRLVSGLNESTLAHLEQERHRP